MDVINLLICFSFVIVFPIVVSIIGPRTSYINFFTLEGLLWRIFSFLSKSINKKYKEKYAQRISSLKEDVQSEIIIPTLKHSEEQGFYGTNQEGNSLLLRITLTKNTITTVYLHLQVQNNTYTLPVENGILETNVPKNRWKIDGLNLEVVEPFKRLRICFNGILKTDRDTTDHIQFNFIFNASCSSFYFPSDIDDTIFRKFLLFEKVKSIFGSSCQPLLNDQIELIQFGVLKGLLRKNSSEEIVLHLPTCRTRYKGIESKYVYSKVFYINAIDECGNSFHIGIKHFKNGSSRLVYGFSYLTARDQRYPITSIHIEEFLSVKGNILPEYIIATARANNKTFKINILIHKTEIQATKTSYIKGYAIYTAACGCNINENEGRACVEARYPFEGPNNFVPEKRLTEKIVDSLPNILLCDIKDERSQIVDLTGGKGCSLALLTSLHSSEFKIPDGFIITVNAYDLYINGELVREINSLSDICCGKKGGKLEEACNRTVKCFKNQKFPENLKERIILQLQKYPKENDRLSWAVRSSAIGEDSEELSSAGQNETFLGCHSYEQILEAIQACWASLYTYQSVHYRWQHGIPVVTSMAVVVQKMVKADSAGVLFTCHPSTCNPSQMVITSNFGLGETVVSGDSDPDTYILNKRSNSIIQVESKELGTKNKILTLTKEGLQETAAKEDIFSLSDEQAIRLGKVGWLLEKAFGNPRDIEWGFYNGQLFLFQSRPITTLTTWTDYELSHELDFPQLTKLSACTTANIREVVPKASTVLSRTSSLRCLDWAIQKLVTCNFDPASMKALITYQHNVFLDVIKGIHMNTKQEIEASSITVDLAIFGHRVIDKNLNDICNKIREPSTGYDTFSTLLWSIKCAWQNHDVNKRAQNLVRTLDLKGSSLQEIYDKIDTALATNVEEIAICHSHTTGTSVFYQMLTMNILLEGKQDITDDHISDFALILSSCEDVISAEVPKYLEQIASTLKDTENKERFKNVDATEGVTWLKDNCPVAYELYTEFMKKHGHRSRGEFEIMEETWNDNPSQVIAMIQANLGVERKEKDRMGIDEIIKNLKSPKSSITRLIVKFLMKKIRVAVGIREQTKSVLVLAVDKLRRAYRNLSSQMVLNGILPHKDLIYHLTHEEVKLLIKSRNPLLISKAMLRQKLYSKWKAMRFAEVMFGLPEPEKDEDDTEISDLKDMCKGTAVCRGIVQARACVIRNLDEISQLQKGDVLITYSTDIGWSPYFPMLSGVVTELGGLVSHGAVVAREYGLPCVVGVKNVLKYFKTGDKIYLNGNTGELGKL
ncbi:rifampicin phosphotransferase-like [Diabrotica undecimpunctata]|uniref:rifampicin phosphotransferase-like n=1 Tax=Diabrotica undecimpunctata TaxID=50387 RepID=UPI003B639374